MKVPLLLHHNQHNPRRLGGQNDSQNRELYFRYLAGEIDLKDPYFTAADLNGDGSITVSDLVIFRKSHGLISIFPILHG